MTRHRQRFPLANPVSYTVQYEAETLRLVKILAARARLPVSETLRRLLDEKVAEIFREVDGGKP